MSPDYTYMPKSLDSITRISAVLALLPDHCRLSVIERLIQRGVRRQSVIEHETETEKAPREITRFLVALPP